MARAKNQARPASDNNHLYNSGTFFNKDRVDCSDLRVVPFIPLNCNKHEFAHLKKSGEGYISLAAGESLVEVNDE